MMYVFDGLVLGGCWQAVPQPPQNLFAPNIDLTAVSTNSHIHTHTHILIQEHINTNTHFVYTNRRMHTNTHVN